MSTFDETIEKLKTQITGHVAVIKATASWAEVEKLFTALNTIEGLAEAPKSSLSEIFGFIGDVDTVSVQPGEFIGMDAIEAAKKYMDKKKNVASSLDDIMDAIVRGGAQSVTREALAMSLARSTWDVVKAPGQELYTLTKYTTVKRGRKKGGAQAADAVQEADVNAQAAGDGK
jgi:hypothetical protein